MTGRWVAEGLETSLDHFHLGPVNLTIEPGRALAVLGPSGAGKTTLLRALAGFLPVRRGRLFRDGVDVSDWPPESRGLGYVPQGLGLLPQRTVEGNVRYPLEIRGRRDAASRTRELLEKFHLTALARRYPARLSGGEQQRVAIARALAADPGLIVWDEPWQGLDVLARYELGMALHELRENDRTPVVLVTHDSALAFSIADEFLVVHAGQVRRQCEASALLDRPADAFSARFVGLPNVFEPAALRAAPAGSLGAWLRERSGSEGVAFPAVRAEIPARAGAPWSGIVRSLRPTPEGVLIEVTVDELMVVLRVAPTGSVAMPSVGRPVSFEVDSSVLHALGPAGTPRGNP